MNVGSLYLYFISNEILIINASTREKQENRQTATYARF